MIAYSSVSNTVCQV